MRPIRLLAAMLVLFWTTSAAAQDVTVSFYGTLTLVESSPFPELTVGVPFTGSYTYSLSTPDTNVAPQVGDYQHISAPYGVTVTIGTHTFRTDPQNVNFLVELVNDYFDLDNYQFLSYNNVNTDGASVQLIHFQLDDPTQTALVDTSLPASPPDLSRWQQIFGLDVDGYSSEGVHFLLRGTLSLVQLGGGPILIPGPPGPPGPQGSQGPEGPAGAQGAEGPAGPQGPEGASGPQGPAGPIGPQGAEGAQGAQGAQGPAGAVGPQGPAGSQGAEGPAGAIGPQGSEGAPGAQGPAGAIGPQGPEGAPGAQGAPGPQGPAGPTGPQGAEGPQGATGPAGAEGPQGVPGAPGAAGPQGPAGSAGPAGPQGFPGPQGPTGPAGPQGEGVFSGSMVMVPSGAPVPAGYVYVGTFDLIPSSGGRSAAIAVDVYRKQ